MHCDIFVLRYCISSVHCLKKFFGCSNHHTVVRETVLNGTCTSFSSYIIVRTSSSNCIIIPDLRPRHVLHPRLRPYKYGVASTLPVLTFIHFSLTIHFLLLFFSFVYFSCCALSFLGYLPRF